MKKLLLLPVLALAVQQLAALPEMPAVRLAPGSVAIYPQSFEPGGWSLDAQFMKIKGHTLR